MTRTITFEMVDDPARCGGKPCLPGHRITINQIIAMVIEGMTRAEIFDYWGKDYFDDLDLNDYIDFAERVVGDNGYCPGGLKFVKTWEEVSAEEDEKAQYTPYGKHEKVLKLTSEDIELLKRTGGFDNEKV